jgi:Coenzyme PQQ synthesis protein D (PqqD)
MQLSSRPRHAADFSLRQFEDEILLFDPGSATVIWLNQTAALLWCLCDGERSVVEMIDLLCETYPLESGRLRSDVEEAIDLLSGHGALVIE